jgi:hypothetical protein
LTFQGLSQPTIEEWDVLIRVLLQFVLPVQMEREFSEQSPGDDCARHRFWFGLTLPMA